MMSAFLLSSSDFYTHENILYFKLVKYSTHFKSFINVSKSMQYKKKVSYPDKTIL